MAASGDRQFSCLYINANLFHDKIDDLKVVIRNSQKMVIGITEINPKRNEDLITNGYKVFISPTKDISGNVCLYIRDTLASSLSDVNVDVGFRESVWVEVNVDDTKVLVGCIYRSKRNSNHVNNRALCTLIEKLNKDRPHVLVMGNFNYPELNWTVDVNATIEGRAAHHLFFKSTRQASLTPHIKVPTLTPQIKNVQVFSRGNGGVNDLKVIQETSNQIQFYMITFEFKANPALTRSAAAAVEAAAAAATAAEAAEASAEAAAGASKAAAKAAAAAKEAVAMVATAALYF